MKQSKLFIKTRKEAPADEVSKNAELLIRGGFINKEMAGVYSYLPLGLRVMNKISNIVREEMDAVGGQEIKMTVLQDSDVWQKSGRWSDDVVDNWFKTKLKNETELGLGFTHEEPITEMLKNHINSYRDLPVCVYQIQAKFRNEARAKSGVMRGREFLMKDMYSFSKNEEEHNSFYEKVQKAYKKVYERLGIGHLTYMTFASGGTFSKYSHEFQTITSAGEDTIYVDEDKGIAINQEVLNEEVLSDLGVSRENLVEQKAVEVGNIFTLGTKFSDPINLVYKDEEGKEQKVFMGSYGIGPSRLMGTIVEVLSDEKGIIWPKEVSPFHVHLISLGENEKAEEIYNELNSSGVEVLLDDREAPAGEKFADSDLFGIPLRVVVSKRSLEEGGYEIKYRKDEKGRIVSKEELISELKDYVFKTL
ncbi:MAG: prolyl-tRNA synthetase [Patescibacteria group bacterium]|jgi:prolyl-tRNA synthetase|nr:prolyl-tRNA synthetase [Patescibacteria group bacterium]